jgi:D-3-phosphoglycerate dehydrogenase
MPSVFHVEYRGALAPYHFEQETLAAAGVDFAWDRCASADDVITAAKGAQVLWLEWTPNVTRAVLQALPECELVIRWGVGYDQIDVPGATELGVAVANAPTYCTIDVAEHAIALLLALTRQIPLRNEQLHRGGWREGATQYRRLAGRTLGVVGVGRIGSRVARLGTALGCRVLGYDIAAERIAVPGVTMTDFDTLLRESDSISIHVPLSDTTYHMFDERVFAAMKEGAILINTSRGAVVKEEALIQALEQGTVHCAGLDVYREEPLPVASRLRTMPRVLLTPHEAASSPESLRDLRKEVCGATLEWLRTGWTSSVVNPEVRSSLRRRG